VKNSEEQQTALGPKNWEVIKLNQVGTAPEALLGLFRYQAKQAKFLWSVERKTHRGSPDNFDPVRRRATYTRSSCLVSRRAIPPKIATGPIFGATANRGTAL